MFKFMETTTFLVVTTALLVVGLFTVPFSGVTGILILALITVVVLAVMLDRDGKSPSFTEDEIAAINAAIASPEMANLKKSIVEINEYLKEKNQ